MQVKALDKLRNNEPVILSVIIFFAVNILVYMFLNGMANVGCSDVVSDYHSQCFTFRPALAGLILIIDIFVLAFWRLAWIKR